MAKSDVNMHLSLNRLQVRTDQSAFVIQPIFKKIILIQAEFYKYSKYSGNIPFKKIGLLYTQKHKS